MKKKAILCSQVWVFSENTSFPMRDYIGASPLQWGKLVVQCRVAYCTLGARRHSGLKSHFYGAGTLRLLLTRGLDTQTSNICTLAQTHTGRERCAAAGSVLAASPPHVSHCWFASIAPGSGAKTNNLLFVTVFTTLEGFYTSFLCFFFSTLKKKTYRSPYTLQFLLFDIFCGS